jgi:crotonobetainyl-CoA:carnitine CoA-transferase CaiB-like acyl-CoA transferase
VAQGSTVAGLGHFASRKAFRRHPRDGFLQPDFPYRLHSAVLREPQSPARLGEHTGLYRDTDAPHVVPGLSVDADEPLPFEGMRVLDMTAFWAGPSMTHVLAMLGAEVVHLESTTRPDGTRLNARLPMSEDLVWEKGPLFAALNTNKKSVTINFQTEQGRDLLRRLIADCDVVVENYTPRVLDQIGLDYEAMRAIRPDVIMVRMPGFGLDGPWRDSAAFAYVIEDASGLTWLTGHPDQSPDEPYTLGDPNAGLHALNGLLLALEHRRRTGDGMLVESAMIDAALNITAEQIIEYSANGMELMRDGNRGPAATPQNLYRTGNLDEYGGQDSWVAVAVATDTQWASLCAALGQPAWTTDPALATAAGRRAQHDLIDEHLAGWCRQRSAGEIVERLWAAGVPVAKVMQPHRQTELAQLQTRGFFETVDHPVGGAARYSTMPMRFSGGPERLHRTPAPMLGEHNTAVLTRLGLTTSQIEDLAAQGVIGDRPAW